MADKNSDAIGLTDFAVLAALDLPVVLIDRETTVVHQNAAARIHLGTFPERAALAARIRSPAILDMVARVIADGDTRTVELVEKVPSERWFEVRAAAVSGDAAEGDATGRTGASLFVLSFRDLTEARRLDRMRSDFVANASHELRTPLASLMGFVETMQGPARDDAKARERFLGIMLDQASRMSRLIDDLLSLSRLELRSHVAPQGRVDLVEIAGHVCDALRPMAAEIGVEINLSHGDRPVIVSGDRDELIQVLENLIENACKYGQSGGRVDVGIEPDTGMGTLVSVRDYGPGIARQHVPRLTERFYRVDVESSRTKKGTGLGLAIVKHILTRHRARLLVRSEPGEGSTFSVRFNRESDARG
ncbi:two-component system phosphate regulon sensor histidine kinase PhoR [Hoeflea marina]|uniref:histidine kinase n=1 Tax=Hoeflea marina TaxID=274592 RepID=A0A317PLM9_9HYPH|nr:phosphate regulon sensor histidine kinase PhoR [Hoeflea marina]PWV99946.1 two-component system phosphate regulon sensor histidine kinase PhoR [Hoeflea marina]